MFGWLQCIQELEAIRAKVKEMEEEQKKLLEMQGEVDKELQSSNQTVKSSGSGQSFPTPEEKQEIDARSIYVGNVCRLSVTLLSYPPAELTKLGWHQSWFTTANAVLISDIVKICLLCV